MKIAVFVPFSSDLRLYSELGEVYPVRGYPQLARFLKDPSKFDMAAFTGGEDLNPKLYRHRNLGSHYNDARDEFEIQAMKASLAAGLVLAGICRGAQLANVLLGGTMGQDLGGDHGGHHPIQTVIGESFRTNSAHHQLIVPTQAEYIYGWAEETVRPELVKYDGELPGYMLDAEGRVKVTEMVYYPEQRAFMTQFHPEWMPRESRATELYLSGLELLLAGKTLPTAKTVEAGAQPRPGRGFSSPLDY